MSDTLRFYDSPPRLCFVLHGGEGRRDLSLAVRRASQPSELLSLSGRSLTPLFLRNLSEALNPFLSALQLSLHIHYPAPSLGLPGCRFHSGSVHIQVCHLPTQRGVWKPTDRLDPGQASAEGPWSQPFSGSKGFYPQPDTVPGHSKTRALGNVKD